MARLFESRWHKTGLDPGALVFVGDRKVERAKITVIEYGRGRFAEREVTPEEVPAPEAKSKGMVRWIDVEGLHEPRALERIGREYGLHSLVLEDILDTGHRPKSEDHDDYVYVVLKMLTYDDRTFGIMAEQVSLVLGPAYLLSFQERPGDVFEQVRERIRGGKGRTTQMGADYLLYSLLDAIVDDYFVALEKLGERVEELHDRILADPATEILRSLHQMRREMVLLRRATWPIREVVDSLERGESPLLSKETTFFLRDIYDHTVQNDDHHHHPATDPDRRLSRGNRPHAGHQHRDDCLL